MHLTRNSCAISSLRPGRVWMFKNYTTQTLDCSTKEKSYNTEKQTFTKPENLSAENRKCTKRAPDIIFIKNSSIIWSPFLLGYMSII